MAYVTLPYVCETLCWYKSRFQGLNKIMYLVSVYLSFSDSDSDEVIDIEAIDELGSIMSIPDKKSTFSSARTAPLTSTTAATAPRRKSAPSVTTDGTSEDGLISSPSKTTQRQVSGIDL